MPVRRCPVCSLVNPATAQVCDCGYSFATGQQGQSLLVSKQAHDGPRGSTFAERMALRLVIRVVAILVVAAVVAGLRACSAS